MINVEIHIVGDKQIELAVVVIIDESCAGGPARISHAGALRNVLKGAVSVVLQQMVCTQASHVDIVKAVVIVIANRHSHAPANVAYPGSVRYVEERPVAVIVIESTSGLLF